MSGGEQRLDRMYTALTARERVLLLQQARFSDAPHDPAILRTMPSEQEREFSHLIGLADSVLVSGPLALDVQRQVAILGMKSLTVQALMAWGGDRSLILSTAACAVREPIKASEHAALLAQAQTEPASWQEAVEVVANERASSQRAADRALRGAVNAAQIAMQPRGRSRTVELGALYKWLGVEFPLRPASRGAYEIVPDDSWTEQHEQGRQAAQQFAKLVARGDSGPGAGAMDILRAQLQTELPAVRSQLLAVELVTAEIVAEFADEAVLPADLRTALTDTRSELDRIAASVIFDGQARAAEPDAGLVASLRRARHAH